MPQISDLKTPLSGYRHIDPLLNSSPDWNFFQPAVANTLFYTFVLPPAGSGSGDVTGETVFSSAQKSSARVAILELARYTGIRFVETQDPGQAQIALLNANITLSAQTSGLASWTFGWEDLPGGGFTDYYARGTLYLDNVEFGVQNSNLSAGSRGYETLLHELGHLIGLKHPHETTPDNPTQLPAGQDDTKFTIMSYTSLSRPGFTFAPYDIAALRWLYGGDGLGGRGATEGSGMFLTGTAVADTLLGSVHSDIFDGAGGNDVIDGGGGLDFVQLNVTRNMVTLARNADGFALGDGGSVDQLINVERVLYTGGALALDLDGAGGQAYRIYNAAFDRAPDAQGLGFWIAQLDKGVALSAIAAGFLGSDEFVAKYGANMAHQAFVETLYQNILDRAGDQGGIDFWVGNLNNGLTDQSTVLAHFSESDENVANVAALIGNGIEYIAYG